MKLSSYLLATALAAGLATAETPPKICHDYYVSLNATNIDTLANCTLYSYQCYDNKGKNDGKGITYTTTAPPVNCTKAGYEMFFSDYNVTGPLRVPRMVEVQKLYLEGYSRWIGNVSTINETFWYLHVDSIDFPDLVNITLSGLSVKYAQNVSSMKFPKLENIQGRMNIDLSGGPASSLSFPRLRDVYHISINGKIDALDFSALNTSRSVNVTSTGNLDCVAFAAAVVNTTEWYEGAPESVSCISNKNSIKTHPVPAEDTSGSSGVSWFRGDLLLLAVLVCSVSLVI